MVPLLAWLGMMGFTIFVITHRSSYSHIPSTVGLAICFTPFRYLPFLFVPYAFGATIGMFWNKWAKWKDGKRGDMTSVMYLSGCFTLLCEEFTSCEN